MQFDARTDLGDKLGDDGYGHYMVIYDIMPFRGPPVAYSTCIYESARDARLVVVSSISISIAVDIFSPDFGAGMKDRDFRWMAGGCSCSQRSELHM